MCNAGDMNGDGIEDLAITYSTDIPWGAYKSIAIFLGRSNPQITPDYVCTIPYTSVLPVYLGDVNGNGISDLAFWGWHLSQRYSYFTFIWTDLESDPIHFMDGGVYGSPIYLGGVGDVNGDGFDDAYLAFPNTQGDIGLHGANLLYGNESASMVVSQMLVESFDDGNPRVSPLGDINGDGFADFLGYAVWPNHYLWLGSTAQDSIPDLTLSLNSPDYDMHSFQSPDTEYAVYGDLNGDGYDDFICSDPYTNGYNGQAGLWLGGPYVNSTVDLVFDPPSDWQWRNFGHAKAVGDFDGDGYDDLALSCPRWMDGGFHFPGRIYVFSGNAQLEDTTVANDDPVAPPASVEDWRMNVYPNPCSRYETELKVDLLGSAYAKDGSYTYRIYNVRGQLIKQEAISISELRDGSFSVRLELYSTGIYLITINDKSQVLISKKVAIY
jgi:hypothetical protein